MGRGLYRRQYRLALQGQAALARNLNAAQSRLKRY